LALLVGSHALIQALKSPIQLTGFTAFDFPGAQSQHFEQCHTRLRRLVDPDILQYGFRLAMMGDDKCFAILGDITNHF
jgi:hypothetical protein